MPLGAGEGCFVWAVASGAEAPGDHFGFGSVNIGSFKSLNFTAPLTPATNVIELATTTGDVSIRELQGAWSAISGRCGCCFFWRRGSEPERPRG